MTFLYLIDLIVLNISVTIFQEPLPDLNFKISVTFKEYTAGSNLEFLCYAKLKNSKLFLKKIVSLYDVISINPIIKK